MKDNKIISELKNGNYKVFKHLYAHYDPIEKYVLSNSGYKEDAKDLFQNSLITFYEMVKKPDFELNSKISTLLYSISKNNWLKKITRQKEVTTENIISEVEESKSLGIQNPFETLMKILEKVGEPCKSLLMLFHFDKLTWEVIASKLNYANAHTARQQKHKCFLKIRKIVPENLKAQILGYGS